MKIPYFGTVLATGAVTFAFAVLGGVQSASAQILTYNNLNDFSNDSAPAYFEPFTQYNGHQHVTSPQTFPNAQPTGYKFTLSDSDPNGINYSSHPGQSSVFPAVSQSGDSFTITFPLANVSAFAGTFFLTNSLFTPLSGGNVVVTAYTATSHEAVTLATTGSYGTEPFAGFTSVLPFTEITVTAPDNVGDLAAFVSLDSLYLSQSFDTVPEPSTWALMFGGLGLLLLVMRQRARRVAVAL